MQPKTGDKLRVINQNMSDIPMYTQVIFEGDYGDEYCVIHEGEKKMIEKDSVCLVEDEPEMVFGVDDYALVVNNKQSEHTFPIGSLIAITNVGPHTEHGRRLTALNKAIDPEKQIVYWFNLRKIKKGEKVRVKDDETKTEFTASGSGQTRPQYITTIEDKKIHISLVIFVDDEFVNIHDDEQDQWGEGWD